MERKKHTKEEKQKELNQVITWVNNQFEKNDPPRFTDVFDYTYRVLKFNNLKKGDLRKILRLYQGYAMNARQSRQARRSGKNRPIIVNTLGHLHCDLGFFALTREYETPVTFKSGYLVAKDILSRVVYVAILQKSKNADALIKAFSNVFEQFKMQNKGLKVLSVSFDKEPTVMGHRVQEFLKDNNVSFYAFANSASKSKFAESAIRLLRETITRLKMNPTSTERRWWHLIQPAVQVLNNQPIKVNDKYLLQPNGSYFRPVDVNVINLDYYIKQLQKAAPAYYFSQFDVDPSMVKFKFNVGDFVKPKLIITSSAVLGIKRSEVTLESETFVITKRLGFVSKTLTIEPLYVCKSTITGQRENFEENDIALSNPPPL
jgi:hypothetical protein